MTSKLFHLEKTGGLIDLLAGRAGWAEVANDYSSLTIVPVGNGARSSLDLGPVDIHFNSMTVTARLIMALKL